MSEIVILRGPDIGRNFPLQKERAILGRNADCAVALAGKQVSRQHAQIFRREGQCFIEDLGSANGTFVNGERLTPNAAIKLTDQDTFQIGPYLLALRQPVPIVPAREEPVLIVRETVDVLSPTQTLFAQDPATKLQVVLEINQHLARTLEIEPLLEKVVEQLMKLFSQADRVMVILCEGDQLLVRAQRARRLGDQTAQPFSRTIVRRALDEGIGIISEDIRSDERFQASHTITSLELHSVICAPMITQDKRRLGVIQVDRFCKGYGFRVDDLHLLTAIAMEVSIVLDNAALHVEKLREQRLMQELAFAHDIQEGYLPDELEGFPEADFEIFGRVYPARQVAGDFYDFVKTPAGRLAFFIGDVSGKGMPAALYMIAVRTLCRHLVKETDRPAQLLAKLNVELAEDNPSCMFVTLAHGIYEPATGQVVMASAGHPPPFLRKADGSIDPIAIKPGRLLGYGGEGVLCAEAHFTLAPGDALHFFTDGFFEARSNIGKGMFGLERVRAVFQECGPGRTLADGATAAKDAIDRFTGMKEMQDDLTLLTLRRLASPIAKTESEDRTRQIHRSVR
ncbi:MAG: FHA domain-containing protein [Gemmataceae bacterium]|nr:FHA domain-containing protein [Gemmataceae bacterium]